MNRGVLQSSPVQQMMAGSPNWWDINTSMRPPGSHHHHQQYSFLPPNSFLPPTTSWNHDVQELPSDSWSQLVLGGLVGEEDNIKGLNNMQTTKKLENWEELLNHHQNSIMNVKEEHSSASSYTATNYGNNQGNVGFETANPNTWSHQMMPLSSSPKSCVTTLSSSNMLDFTNKSADNGKHRLSDVSSECNSTATGGATKKARVQPSSSQSTFKVRKEKLGDRITALHQLVSPFGKTDTASVLLEAIGYIRFLQSQIEALSLPYLGNGSTNNRRLHQQSAQVEKNCLFSEDPGQDSHEEPKKDLRARGLCLVPISCTLQVGSDNGADYWAPAFGANFR